jgi:hypothetical protein
MILHGFNLFENIYRCLYKLGVISELIHINTWSKFII